MQHRFSSIPKLIVVGVLPAVFVLTTAGSVLAGLVSGALPAAAFTYTSTTINDVNIAGDGVHLKTKGPVTIKTTFSSVAPSDNFVGGWHYHNGPVLVTVTAGTLTLFGDDCQSWDISAGQTYIESTGQLLNAKLMPSKNVGVANVQWFTTRLYPEGAADPAPVDPPCVP
jgi:hypothetical protein